MNIPRLDAWSLYCLVVLVRERSVTRAATVLGMSQPAASAMLAKLRQLFNDPLLIKSSSQMMPSERALHLAQTAESLVGQMQSMLATQGPFDPKNFSGNIVIVAVDYMRLLAVPTLARVLEKEAPNVTLTVREANRIHIHEWMERADVDLGLGPGVVPSGRMHFKQLCNDQAVCIARTDHPAFREPMTPERFCSLRHVQITPSRPSFYDGAIDKALSNIGLKRNIVLSERSFMMIPHIIKETDLVATIPRQLAIHVCAGHNLALFNSPLDLPGMKFGLYWHSRAHQDPLNRWIRGVIQNLINFDSAKQADIPSMTRAC